MPSVILRAVVPTAKVGQVLATVLDFSAYPHHTTAVREVTTTRLPDGRLTSRWTVNFQRGTLCWTEIDEVDEKAGAIAFQQTEGDFDSFEGSWQVQQLGLDVAIHFVAQFDLGMPSLAEIVDPIAEHALAETITNVLHGLFGMD